MAWFSGRVSLGSFPDLAGAVNKISESVKNIEKNFDSALGLEEKSDATGSDDSGLRPSATDKKTLFEPVMAFMGHKSEDSTEESLTKFESSTPDESSLKSESFKSSSPVKEKDGIKETDSLASSSVEQIMPAEDTNTEAKIADLRPDSEEEMKIAAGLQNDIIALVHTQADTRSSPMPAVVSEIDAERLDRIDSSENAKEEEDSWKGSSGNSELTELESMPHKDQVLDKIEGSASEPVATLSVISLQDNAGEHLIKKEEVKEEASAIEAPEDSTGQVHNEEFSGSDSATSNETGSAEESLEGHLPVGANIDKTSEVVSDMVLHENDAISESVEANQKENDNEAGSKEPILIVERNLPDHEDSMAELKKVKREMKMMETALQGAARQAQAKADEIAKLMNENEQLKSALEDLRRKSNEAEIESLREEYHQKVAALERKVYALTRERDTLRREQNKKSDAAALLKEKDEIINQVMAEGEQLSKKQAAQESQIRKLRAQIREFEEEKKGLLSNLQVEENKVESLKRDKAATEKLLQETVEKHQAELATQKEYYTNALNAAKEAEALAEARANNEARTELESRLRGAQEREAVLVQAVEELRQTLSRNEQQAVFREDMLRRDIEDLQKRYQASERRCEELITQVPDSTRPLLRQIEAMQETNARRAEAWAAVEKTLTSRLQEAEGKAAAAEEKERSVNERLSQTLSRINVLEAQISCLRAEQTQLTRSLEKERQRAAENRQEYLAIKEEAETNEGRAKQLEEEIKELKRKHKQELQEALAHQETLQQELEREKAARLDQERATRLQSSVPSDQSTLTRQKSSFDNGSLTRKLSSASSLSSMEESYFLQASLDSSENLSERKNLGEGAMSPYYLRSMTPSAFEATLRQKEGELASYMSRLASLESIRDSLAEELVKMTAQCEKLQAEAAMVPGMRAELDALRRRHSAALELMGERDEELEELRADIVDLKEMYREQVNLLVNKIQVLSSSISAAS